MYILSGTKINFYGKFDLLTLKYFIDLQDNVPEKFEIDLRV